MNWAFGSGLGQPINPQAMAQGQGLWSPEQLAQGFQLARGQGATLGNAQGMAQAQAEQQQNLAAMMEQYKRAQGDLERAAALQSPEYVQNSGALGALAMIAQAAAGRRLERKADERASDYAGRVFAEQQRMEQAKKAEEEAKAQRERNEELARADALRAYEASREDARFAREDERWNKSFALQERSLNASLARQAQGSARPTLSDKIAEVETALGRRLSEQERASVIGIEQPTGTPSRPDPVAVRDAADRARAAREALQTLGELNQLHKDGGMFGGISTGPLDQFAPGASGQKYDQLASTLNLSTLRANFGGNPAEGERAANAETLPSRSRYESVNKDRIEQLRAQMVARIEEHNRIPGVEPVEIPAWALEKPGQPPANMGGQGPNRNLQNPPPAAGGWSVRPIP